MGWDMSMSIAGTEFDEVHYDSRGDVLYLRVSPFREPACTLEIPGGHTVDYDARGNMIGLALLNVRWTLEREGAIALHRPAEVLEAEQLESVLAGV